MLSKKCLNLIETRLPNLVKITLVDFHTLHRHLFSIIKVYLIMSVDILVSDVCTSNVYIILQARVNITAKPVDNIPLICK